MPGLVGVLTVFGMVVVAPVGLLLLATPGFGRLARCWPALGLLAGIALLLPRGALAVALALPYAAGCGVAAALAAARGLRWLRNRRTPLLPFAAVLLAGLAARAAPSRLAAAAAWSVPAGTLVTLVGFFTGNAVELAGATVLTAGLLATAYVLLVRIVPGVTDRPARALLVVAALAAPVSMALAMWWAAGEAFGFAHPTLREMAATHGVVNALGVGVCGLVGWRRIAPPPL